MEFRTLGRSGVKVSPLCLGAMNFGGPTAEEESIQIINRALDGGINFIDTANVYNNGESERITGKGIRGRRDQVVLATKVRGRMGEDPNSEGLSRRNILSSLDNSLKRLNTDYVDLYYLHAPDDLTALEETMETMSGLVQRGKIRYIGVSNYAAWQIADIMAICDKRGYVAPVITQNVYNVLTRGIEPELVPCIQAHPMGLAVYNPIAGGLLSGKHKMGQPESNTRFALNATYADRYWSEENFAAIASLEELARQEGISLLALALKWCDAQSAVTSIIMGVSRLAQLEQNAAALTGEPLSARTLARCDEIWAGLAGTRFRYNR